MEKFEELMQNSQKRIHIADHILTQTYPLIKDPKLLLAVVENTFLALTNSMSSLLYFESRLKRIPEFPDTFDAKFTLFREVASRYSLVDHIPLIQDIKNIVVEHRKSPIEFVRDDRFVICSDTYQMKTIDVHQMKKYLSSAKNFVQEITSIISHGVDSHA